MVMFCLFFLSVEIELERSVPIDALIRPVVSGAADGSFWVGDVHSGKLVHFDQEGHVSRTINYGSGQGPGEFSHPRHIMEFPQSRLLVVVCLHGKTLVFSTETGEWERNIIDFLPYSGCARVDEKTFVFFWGQKPGSTAADGFSFFDLNGKLIDFWEVPQPRWQKNFIYELPQGHVIDKDKNVFVGFGGKPQVFEYSYKNPKKANWNLHPPKGYRPPPEKDFPISAGLDKAALNDYFGSFSFISNVFLLSERYLMVVWKNRAPLAKTMDIYDIPTKQRVLYDYELQGLVYDAAGNHLFVSRYTESEDIDQDDTLEIEVHSVNF